MTLRLYAIVRADLKMPPGKMAAQAGHAFIGALLESQKQKPEVAQEYIDDMPGTKVVLSSPDLEQMKWAEEMCKMYSIPCYLVTDSGHILPPHFDGNPIITALGIGPCARGTVSFLTDHFKLV